MSIKKRLVLGSAAFTTVAAAATLVAGVTFGLFSSSVSNGPSTFTSGTISLVNSATSFTCPVTKTVMPGDSGSCTFNVDYTGNAPAFIGLNTTTTNPSMPELVIQVNAGTYAINGTNLYVATDTGVSTVTHTFTVSWSLPLSVTNPAEEGQTASISLTAHAVQSANNGSDGACVVGSACPGITTW